MPYQCPRTRTFPSTHLHLHLQSAICNLHLHLQTPHTQSRCDTSKHKPQNARTRGGFKSANPTFTLTLNCDSGVQLPVASSPALSNPLRVSGVSVRSRSVNIHSRRTVNHSTTVENYFSYMGRIRCRHTVHVLDNIYIRNKRLTNHFHVMSWPQRRK